MYTAWCLTCVSKQMRMVFPSTVTEMFLSSLKSTLSSPNMSLSAADKLLLESSEQRLHTDTIWI